MELILTILFNPALLALLLILFFAGKLLGKLSVRMNIWKILLLAYFAVFLIEPLRDAGWFIGGIFILGFFSNHITRLPGILGWAESLSDIYFAYKYRQAYDDIRTQEREAEARYRREREEAARQNTGRSNTQQSWKEEAQRQRGNKTGSQHQQRASGRDDTGRGSSSNHTRFKPQSDSNNAGPSSTSIRNGHLLALGLNPSQTYTLRDIKKAYNKRVKETHPDVGGSSHELRQVRNAWEWLRVGMQ